MCNNSSLSTIVLLSLFLVFSACRQRLVEPTDFDTQFKNVVVELMREWYLWNTEMPADIDVSRYATPNDLIRGIRNPQDRWSYIEDEISYFQFFEAGQLVGYGMGLRFVSANELFISYVFRESPAGKAGLERGDQILSINGKDLASISNIAAEFGENRVGVLTALRIRKANGSTQELNLVKENLQINAVLHRSVHQAGTRKVGYLVFNNFVETAQEELKQTLSYFQQEGVNEVVLDMRYNGGGRISVAEFLASALVPAGNTGNTFINYQHNAQKSAENQAIKFKAPEVNLNLSRLVVIATGSTASASELIISGLKPYMQVIQIGDNSYGKPVGSYAWRYQGQVIVPVSLEMTNAKGEGRYFDGLPADALRPDDVRRNFGDPEESCLKEALYYLQHGGFSTTPSARLDLSLRQQNQDLYGQGFRAEVQAF